MDDYGHGTHCAGTVGGVGNKGVGVVGVCWNIEIMAIKFLKWCFFCELNERKWAQFAGFFEQDFLKNWVFDRKFGVISGGMLVFGRKMGAVVSGCRVWVK